MIKNCPEWRDYCFYLPAGILGLSVLGYGMYDMLCQCAGLLKVDVSTLFPTCLVGLIGICVWAILALIIAAIGGIVIGYPLAEIIVWWAKRSE